MASALTHIFTAAALGKTYTQEKMPVRFWALLVLCSLVPDIDIIGYYYGIGYGDVFGHRGFTHSLLFAMLLSAGVVVLCYRTISALSKKWWSLLGFFFAVTLSHGVLDALTDKGYGV